MPAQNVTATIEFPPPLRLLSHHLQQTDLRDGPVRCSLRSAALHGVVYDGNLQNQRTAWHGYTFVSDTAVMGNATITVSTANDGDPTNNVAKMALPVRPYLDIADQLRLISRVYSLTVRPRRSMARSQPAIGFSGQRN